MAVSNVVIAEPKKLTKQDQTCRSLMTATRDLIYDRGVERVAILDITEAAGVTEGSFYAFYENKPAIVAAIVADFHDVFEAYLAETRLRLKDPAMRLSVSLKYYFKASQDNEAWRSFVTSAGLLDRQVLVQPPRQCRDDVSLGARSGRFKTDSVAITQSLITGMAKHVALEIQRGYLPKTAVFEAVRHILRMLGLPDIAAKAFAEAPLPRIGVLVRDDLPADPNIPFRLAIERRKVTRAVEQATAAS